VAEQIENNFNVRDHVLSEKRTTQKLNTATKKSITTAITGFVAWNKT
jgi:hypothetical protein